MPGRVFPTEGTAGAKAQRIGGPRGSGQLEGYQGYLVQVMAVLTGALSQKKLFQGPQGP